MKRILALVVILALAGGYWFYQNRERFFPKPEAVQVAPQRWQVSTTQETPAEPPAPVEVNATNATAQTDQNATENATAAVVPSDEIVGHEFVRDLATYMVERYLPGGTKKNPSGKGRLDLNVKSMNMRYGIDFPGLNVDPADTLGARKIIFTHVLNDTVLDFLQAAYTPLFLDSLEEALNSSTHTLASGQDAAITPAQRTEMMSLLAARLRAVGSTATALARNDAIRAMVAKYLQDMENVSQAHLAFWNLQTENATQTVIDEASARIKTTIQTREISRQRLLQAIVSTAAPQGMDASELVYIAQWIYRRTAENPQAAQTVGKAGEILIKIAGAVQERSSQAPAGEMPEVQGNGTLKVGE